MQTAETRAEKFKAAQSGIDLSPAAKNLEALLMHAVEEGATPGVTLLVSKAGKIIFLQSAGYKSLRGDSDERSVLTPETVFDLAAITEPVVTATLVMKLLESGKLKLEDRVARYIQSFSVHGKSKVSIVHLLNHSSGLPHWIPFFEELIKVQAGSRRGIVTSRGARDFIVTSINRLSLRFEPGIRQLYSDLGFILLGHIVEVLTGLSLEKAAFRYVFQPLGLKSSSYVDLSLIKRRGIHPITELIAPTEDCPWRRRVLCGEVHDDNAWVMGGIAGHSGLFSNAFDLHLFLTELLRAYHGESSYLKASTVQRFWQGASTAAGPWRYGWDSPSRENGMLACGFSPQAVGMHGFTGCSIWAEPASRIAIIVMSNRIHPSRANKKFLALRPEIQRAALEFAEQL